MEKDHILKGCKYLFGKWGVHRVTMDDVSKQLGISKRTLYEVYPNKEAIVTDFVKLCIAESRSELRRGRMRGKTEMIQLSFFNRFIVNQSLALSTVLIYDIRKYHPASYALIKRYETELILFLNDLLVKGQKSGVFRAGINTLLAAELIIHGLAEEVLERDEPGNYIEAKQNLFFDLLLHGLKRNKNIPASKKRRVNSKS